MSTYLLTVNGEVIAEMRCLPREVVSYARYLLESGEVGVLTGADFEKELVGR